MKVLDAGTSSGLVAVNSSAVGMKIPHTNFVLVVFSVVDLLNQDAEQPEIDHLRQALAPAKRTAVTGLPPSVGQP